MRGGGEDVLSSLSLRVGAGGDSCVRGCRAWMWGSKGICPEGALQEGSRRRSLCNVSNHGCNAYSVSRSWRRGGERSVWCVNVRCRWSIRRVMSM